MTLEEFEASQDWSLYKDYERRALAYQAGRDSVLEGDARDARELAEARSIIHDSLKLAYEHAEDTGHPAMCAEFRHGMDALARLARAPLPSGEGLDRIIPAARVADLLGCNIMVSDCVPDGIVIVTKKTLAALLSSPQGGAHGIICHKATHVGDGYLHNSDDDTPYCVDGVYYCGRCHYAIKPPESPTSEGGKV
jgi:hypothetical protein